VNPAGLGGRWLGASPSGKRTTAKTIAISKGLVKLLNIAEGELKIK
jgi:hypothetical protein